MHTFADMLQISLWWTRIRKNVQVSDSCPFKNIRSTFIREFFSIPAKITKMKAWEKNKVENIFQPCVCVRAQGSSQLYSYESEAGLYLFSVVFPLWGHNNSHCIPVLFTSEFGKVYIYSCAGYSGPWKQRPGLPKIFCSAELFQLQKYWREPKPELKHACIKRTYNRAVILWDTDKKTTKCKVI
jgi:hypothetical protein